MPLGRSKEYQAGFITFYLYKSLVATGPKRDWVYFVPAGGHKVHPILPVYPLWV